VVEDETGQHAIYRPVAVRKLNDMSQSSKRSLPADAALARRDREDPWIPVEPDDLGMWV